MKILNNINEVLFESAADTMRQTVLDAIAVGADLSYANLIGADLSDANLIGARLIGANLSRARLIGANLSYANLIDARLISADLSYANLSRARLVGADLSDANLIGARLIGANLSRARLIGANLVGADLSDTDLSYANLIDADLSRARLSDADLSYANLSGTCLAPTLSEYARRFAQSCRAVGQHGGRIVYRTATSAHVGATRYTVGKTFVANALSWDAATACHPGIYAYGTLAELREEFPNTPAVRCYVRDGDYIITAKNAIRCARLRVLGEVK